MILIHMPKLTEYAWVDYSTLLYAANDTDIYKYDSGISSFRIWVMEW